MVNLEDIPKDCLLYDHTKAYLEGLNQKKTFASRKDEPWKIFQTYLTNGLYYPGESYKTRSYYEEILINSGSAKFQHFAGMGYNLYEKSYNFSKIIIKPIIFVEDWGMSTMKERQINLNNTRMSFTYWDYIQASDKVL
ncbi:hypothetical protein H5410_041305 [Solanum commersonii]|uniref:Uncharacterized protein n=1 Tax=Solanum commersonii TaxID=4109 RepID=A0A9J5XT90_SOLCO|nr:hypothetical protein H5410_041305 [Solanum commersonii]